MKKILTLLILFLTLSVSAKRFYSPEFGRFITQDPIGVDGGLNLYNSVSNNMVNGFAGSLGYSGGMGIDVGELIVRQGVDPFGFFELEWEVPNVNSSVSPGRWMDFVSWTKNEKQRFLKSMETAKLRFETLIKQIDLEVKKIDNVIKSKQYKNCCCEIQLKAQITELKDDFNKIIKAIKSDSINLEVYKSVFSVVRPRNVKKDTDAAYVLKTFGDDQLWINIDESGFDDVSTIFHELTHHLSYIVDNENDDGEDASNWRNGQKLEQLYLKDFKDWGTFISAKKFCSAKDLSMVSKNNIRSLFPKFEKCLKGQKKK
jgi:hypothetical protein